MIYSDQDNSDKNFQSSCIKCEEYESRIQQLECDVTEREEEGMYWYRRFEDAKETQSKGSAKARKYPIIKKRGKLT